MKYTEEQVFYKGGTAALFVMSPFQLLCAREAVHEFEFDEYRYVFVLSPSIPTRNEQMIRMAKEWEIDYDTFISTDVTESDFYTNASLFEEEKQLKKYDRLFIGDHRSPECRMLCNVYSKSGALVSFVDDGTASIYVLRGMYEVGMDSDVWGDIYNWYRRKWREEGILARIDDELKKNGIQVTKSMFSVYSDVKPTNYLTKNNNFSALLASDEKADEPENTIYFIGSPTNDFVSMYGVSLSYMEKLICEQLSLVRKKYINQRIVYIPHPRDLNETIPAHCKSLNIEFLRLNTTAEDYLRSRCDQIEAVCGFGSSTQINMKRMFNHLNVIHFQIINPHKKQYNKRIRVLLDYYKQNGIMVNEILIPDAENLISEITLAKQIVLLKDFMLEKIKRRLHL